MLTTGLDPIVGQDPKVLILGSMPGRTRSGSSSITPTPGTSFWFIMGEICGAEPELRYPERATRLTEAGIALWDVLKHCEREGSLDNHILKDTEVANDFNGFLQHHRTVEIICFNGQKAAKSFEKLVVPELSGDIFKRIIPKTLPSTSPANTTTSRAEKVKEWTQAIMPYLPLNSRISHVRFSSRDLLDFPGSAIQYRCLVPRRVAHPRSLATNLRRSSAAERLAANYPLTKRRHSSPSVARRC